VGLLFKCLIRCDFINDFTTVSALFMFCIQVFGELIRCVRTILPMKDPKLVWLQASALAQKTARLTRALKNQEISRYPTYLESFERRYAALTGQQYGLSFCNGTSAIEAALFAANVQPGDEVIVPSCTFHASITPILNAGATPIFADVDSTTLTIAPAEVIQKLSPKTKAVIAVHLWGIPADLKWLREAIAGRGIVLIEDVSHAHGAIYRDLPCGSWGEFGVFSLQGSKAVAAGEGGIVVTDSWEDYIRMSAWGHFDRHGHHFADIGFEGFRRTGVGFKRRMAPLGALLADVDLDYLDTYNGIKQKNVEILDDELSGIEGIQTVQLPYPALRGGFYQGYPIRILKPGVKAAAVQATLAQAGVQSFTYPFEQHHRLPAYTDRAFRQALLTQQCLPSPQESRFHLPVTESLTTQLLLLAPKYLLDLKRNVLQKLKIVLAGVNAKNASTQLPTFRGNLLASRNI